MEFVKWGSGKILPHLSKLSLKTIISSQKTF
jgi:hypothetical protein